MLGAYFILKDVMGDDDDAADKQATEDIEDFELVNNPWAYSVYQVPPYRSDMYRLRINNFGIPIAAARIHKGIGIMYDDEAQIMSGVKLAGTKTDIAVIGQFINNKYGYDVYEKFKKNLSDNEIGRINRYVKNLPNYSKTGYKR